MPSPAPDPGGKCRASRPMTRPDGATMPTPSQSRPELSRWREELLSLQPVSDRDARGASEPYSSPPPHVIPPFPSPGLDLSRWREELYASLELTSVPWPPSAAQDPPHTAGPAEGASAHANWHRADDVPVPRRDPQVPRRW